MNPPFGAAFAIYFLLVNALIYFVVRAVHQLLTPSAEFKPEKTAHPAGGGGGSGGSGEAELAPPARRGKRSSLQVEEEANALGMVSTPGGRRSARRRQRTGGYTPE